MSLGRSVWVSCDGDEDAMCDEEFLLIGNNRCSVVRIGGDGRASVRYWYARDDGVEEWTEWQPTTLYGEDAPHSATTLRGLLR